MLPSSDCDVGFMGFFWSWTWSECEQPLSCIQNWELFQNDTCSNSLVWECNIIAHVQEGWSFITEHNAAFILCLPCSLTDHSEQAKRWYYLFINRFIRPPTQIMQPWAVYVAAAGRITILTHKLWLLHSYTHCM